MKDRYYIYIFILLLAAAAGGWYYNASHRAKQTTNNINKHKPDMVANDVISYQYNAQGQRTRVVAAKNWSHFPTSGKHFFVAPKILDSKTQTNAAAYLTADKAMFDRGAGFAIFTNNVKIDQGKSHLRAATATAYFDKDLHLTKAIASGKHNQPVKFWSNGKLGSNDKAKQPMRGTAKHITYYPKKNEVVLEGNAYVVRGKSNMRAPKIVYNLKTGNMHSQSNGKQRVTFVIDQADRKKL